MIEVMPVEGDTSPEHLARALAAHGLSLERASRDYFLAGRPRSFHLLQEVDCKLILHLNLVDFNVGKHSHFPAWDGQTIHNSPYLQPEDLQEIQRDKRGESGSIQKVVQ